MSGPQLPVILPNEADVFEYAERIKKHLTDATAKWREIADILSAAADEFGFDSRRMQTLRKETKISKSKTSKLITIAKSDRLRDHRSVFEATNAWTVLYEVTKLTDTEFETLLNNVSEGHVVTKNDVNSARAKIAKETDPYRVAFRIQVDINAIRANIFSDRDYEKLREAVEVIEATVKNVRVVESNVFENEVIRFATDVEREFHRVVQAEFEEAKKSYKRRARDKKHFGPYTEEELMPMLADRDYANLFQILESDRFNQAQLYTIAESNVQRRRKQKFGPLVSQRDKAKSTETKIVEQGAKK